MLDISAENTPKLWNKYFIMVSLANIFMAFSIQFISIVLALYVSSLGGTASYTGFILTAFTVSALIMRVISGRLVDKKGRRMVAVVGLATAGLASVLFVFFPYLAALPIIRVIQGIGYSIAVTAIAVAVTDVIPRTHLGEGIGYFGLGRTISMALAPVIALQLIQSGDYRPVFYLSAASLFICTGLMYFCKYDLDPKMIAMRQADIDGDAKRFQKAAPQKASLIWTLFEKSAIPCTLIMILVSVAMTSSMSFITLFARDSGIGNAGLYFTLQAVFMFVSRLAAGKITDKYHPLVSIIPGLALYILSYSLLAIPGGSVPLFFASAVCSGLGGGVIMPALNAVVVKGVPVNRRGAASATFMMAMDIGVGLGSPLWGYIIDHGNFSMVFAGSAIFCLAAVFASAALLGGKRKSKEIEAA
jgi:MFS family permease